MKTLSILLEITIYSGILFFAIMLLKLCFKNRMSPFLHFVIWGLLIARLLVPVTLESSVHLFVIPAEISGEAVQQTPVTNTDTTNNTSGTNQAQPQASAGQQAANAATPFAVTQNTTTARAITLSTEEILLAVWLTGAGIGIIYLTALYALLRERIRKNAQAPSKRLLALFAEVKAELNIRRDVRIIGQCEYGTPAVLFPNTVLMPINTLVSMSDDEVKFMLRHELMHFKRRDHILGMVLSVLSAIYWFNPIVWIAFRQIRADMETACDNDVVRHFNSDEKTKYAAIILSLFSKKHYGNLVLGMVQGNTRKIAEKRIKGVFMNHNSNRKVKITAVLLTSLLLFTCFTTACQPTPEAPLIVGKQDSIEQKVIDSESDSLIGIPKTIEDGFAKGKITVDIDATIELPGISHIPVVKVIPDLFSQETVDKVVQTLMQGQPIYQPSDVLTRAQLQSLLVYYRAMEKEYSEAKGKLGDIISETETALATAPDTVDRIPSDGKLVDIDEDNYEMDGKTKYGFRGQELNVVANLGNIYDAKLYISASGSKKAVSIWFSHRDDFSSYRIYESTIAGVAQGMDMTLSDARALAEKTAIDMGCDYSVAAVRVASKTTHAMDENNLPQQAYVFYFTRQVNDVPTTYEFHEVNNRMLEEEDGTYFEPYPYERMYMVIDDTGIVELQWVSPVKVVETVSENASILNFDEVMDIFEKQILIHNPSNALIDLTLAAEMGMLDGNTDSADVITQYTYTVDRITLGLMQLPVIDNPNEYLLVPVWDFFGTEYVEYNSPVTDQSTGNTKTSDSLDRSADSLLTINAIDGSIIDRSIGY